MVLRLGSTAPGNAFFFIQGNLKQYANELGSIDFEAQTTKGDIKFHDFIGDKWTVLFSHPADFSKLLLLRYECVD